MSVLVELYNIVVVIFLPAICFALLTKRDLKVLIMVYNENIRTILCVYSIRDSVLFDFSCMVIIFYSIT